MRNEKLLQALGLCAKARALITGTPMVCEALKANRKRVKIVLYASNCSENTSKRLHDRCAFYEAQLVRLPYDGDVIAKAVGKSGSIAALAVTEEGLATLLLAALKEKENQQQEN